MSSAIISEAAVDQRLGMSLEDLIKSSSRVQRGKGPPRAPRRKGVADRKNAASSKAHGGRGVSAGQSKIVLSDGSGQDKHGHRGKLMAAKHRNPKVHSAPKTLQAMKLITKADGTVVHKVLRQRGGRIARDPTNRSGQGNSMPLTLEPRGIQAPKQFGDRNNTFARQPMQLHGAAVVNHMDDNRRSSGYQQTESGARSNRSGREDGFARTSGAVVNGSVGKIQLVVADPIEMRNVRVTFQNTRQLSGSAGQNDQKGNGVLFPGGGW